MNRMTRWTIGAAAALLAAGPAAAQDDTLRSDLAADMPG